MLRILTAALACSLAVTAPVWAQSTATGNASSTAAPGTAKADSAGAKFVHDAALGGMTEVELGKLAEKNAMSSDVKAFGKHMVDDHSKTNGELASVAKSKGIELPSALDPQHKKIVDKLAAAKGASFDKAFMAQMVTDHRKTVSLFEKAASGAKDVDIKAFASKALPTLKQHLQMAEETSKAVSKS